MLRSRVLTGSSAFERPLTCGAACDQLRLPSPDFADLVSASVSAMARQPRRVGSVADRRMVRLGGG